MKNKTKLNRALPAGSRRVLHPTLGIRCWLINGEYYRSRNDFLRPPLEIPEDGKPRPRDMRIK